MFRHLIAFLRKLRRLPPALPKAQALAPSRPATRDPFSGSPETADERDPPSRQRLSWPARDLSRSRRLARAAPDDETVEVRSPSPGLAEDDDDATIVLPRAPERNTEPR